MSGTAVPSGTCVTHGFHGMTTCPHCSSSAGPFIPLDRTTDYGFTFGPMIVERVAHDDKIGYVIVIRDEDRSNLIEIRSSPKGRNWTVRAKDCIGDMPLVWGRRG